MAKARCGKKRTQALMRAEEILLSAQPLELVEGGGDGQNIFNHIESLIIIDTSLHSTIERGCKEEATAWVHITLWRG